MYLRARELLTPEQRIDFMTIPADISEWEIATSYTLSPHDLEVIKRRRRDYNRLGFAVQLCLFRFPGWTLSDIKEIPKTVLLFIANQIKVDPLEFQSYAEREQTKHEHMVEIRKEYGYRNFSTREYRNISSSLLSHAMENENSMYLIRTAIEEDSTL
nr:DUF4158 domain-containing protein [Jeotgalibacillus malaysiensis]